MDKTMTIPVEALKPWLETVPEMMLEELSDTFKMLAEPMRLKILRSLCKGELSVQDIAQEVNASQANISKHLALMLDNRMVSRRKEGFKCYYQIVDESIVVACFCISRCVVEKLQDRLSWIQKVNEGLNG